nr:porin family protein [uncultured Alloprevotella sp.]
MKKIVITFLMATAVITVKAQNFNFGIKTGINLSKETKTEVERQVEDFDNEFRKGFHIGGIVTYSINKQWELEGNLMYSQQGYKEHLFSIENNRTIYSIRSNYINLPIAIKYYPLEHLYIEMGPQIGFLLSKKHKIQGEGNITKYIPLKPNHIDLSLFCGLGYNFSNNIFLEARYIHGLNNTYKNVTLSQNRNIQFSIGYLF